MKLEIEGLLRGRDVGYSVRHPDHNHLDEFCCCENRHCHLPGETPEERHRYACLMIAAPEMLELVLGVAKAYNLKKSNVELATTLYELARRAAALLTKIEGGDE